MTLSLKYWQFEFSLLPCACYYHLEIYDWSKQASNYRRELVIRKWFRLYFYFEFKWIFEGIQ